MCYEELVKYVVDHGGTDNLVYAELMAWREPYYEEITRAEKYDDSCGWCCYVIIEQIPGGFVMKHRCHKARGVPRDVFYMDDRTIEERELEWGDAYNRDGSLNLEPEYTI